jgi:hypothetical protein
MLYPSMLDAWKLTQWSLYISHYSELPSRLPERGGGGGGRGGFSAPPPPHHPTVLLRRTPPPPPAYRQFLSCEL